MKLIKILESIMSETGIKTKDSIEEISFASGHAGAHTLTTIFDQVLKLDPYNSGPTFGKLEKIKAVDGWNTNYELRDVDAFSKIIKSKALSVITTDDGPELLVLKIDKGSYLCTIVNPYAVTIGEYFIGLIKVREIKKERYGGISLAQSVELPALQIYWSDVAVEWRGKGLGKQLYSLVYKWATSKGYALASDDTLFEGSAGMWTTYMPEIASYFGVVIDNIIIPITKEEALLDKFKFFKNTDGFIAFENPPKLLRKVYYNLKGLSYSKGEIMVINLDNYSINKPLEGDQTIFDYIEQSSSIPQLLKTLYEEVEYGEDAGKRLPFTSSQKNAKVVILTFRDSILLVKTVSTGEEEVLPKGKRRDKEGKLIKPKKLTRLVAVTI